MSKKKVEKQVAKYLIVDDSGDSGVGLEVVEFADMDAVNEYLSEAGADGDQPDFSGLMLYRAERLVPKISWEPESEGE